MFETFNVKGLNIQNSGKLSLYSYGRNTGLVCDSGEGITQTIPFFEDKLIRGAENKNFIAGSAITEYLVNLLNADGIE
jgi:actin-related protein